MSDLLRRLRRAEAAIQQTGEILVLPDGTETRLSFPTLLTAFEEVHAAAREGREPAHAILPLVRRAVNPDGFVGLIAAIDRSASGLGLYDTDARTAEER